MFIVKIPEPCTENWDKMTPDNNGRFCGSCQKTVVDFTQMSDEQVKNFLLDNKHKNTCGRFNTAQLGRPLENQSVNINAKWFTGLPYTRQVFYAVAVFFILGVSSCNFDGSATIHPKQDSTKQTNTIPQIDTNLEVGEIAINEEDSLPPPKVNIINHPGPILNSRQKVGEPQLYQDNVTQGAPIWEEPIDTNSIPKLVGKIAAPIQADTVVEPVIMGDIAIPILKDSTGRQKNHAR